MNEMEKMKKRELVHVIEELDEDNPWEKVDEEGRIDAMWVTLEENNVTAEDIVIAYSEADRVRKEILKEG
jgi:mRNA-degrading endonuclease YafQ of YafQ-DinJ toxin-antitoxin module